MTKLPQTIERSVNLITGMTSEDYEKRYGKESLYEYKKRATGRTMAIVMEAVGVAMQQPNVAVYCKDHGDYRGHDTNVGGRNIRSMVDHVITSLGLVGFTVDYEGSYAVRIVYNPFQVVHYDLRK